ncbi:MAG: inositol monophosphatase [Pseudomonadota bacterium]
MNDLSLTEQLCDGLIEAARLAGRQEIMPRFRNLAPEMVDTKSGPDDLVTIADTRAEAVIGEAVRALMPDALIVGEEAVEEDPTLLTRMAEAPAAVIIDPIDGTANFAAGLAVFGVILAVVIDRVPVFGLLYDPVMDDWIAGAKGQGAWFGRPDHKRSPLSMPTARPVDQCRGFISTSIFEADAQPAIAATLPRFRRVLNLRCSCHEYRMLATGHGEFILSPGAKPWDHTAGTLIVEELGGRIEAGGPHPYDPAHPKGPILAVANRDTALALSDWDFSR